MGDRNTSSCGSAYSHVTPPVFKFTDVTCVICYDNVKNRAFVNSCSHAFCLSCLLKWAKQKLECPLCKKLFSVVYFSVNSSHAYKQIPLKCLIEPPDMHCSGEIGFNNSQFGRIKRLLEFGNLLTHDSDVLPINTHICKRRDPYVFRKSVYTKNYWALCNPHPKQWLEPEFYLQHPEFLVHLFPWIYRELEVLLKNKEHLIDEAFNLVVSMLHIYEIYCGKCVNYLKPFLGEQTVHFLHELLHFIASRMPMPVYDKVVQYSSVHFLRGNAIRGAIVNGPGEYKEFIMLDSDSQPLIVPGNKRKRATSLFPTITYADVVALTPDRHGGDRIYALDEIGGGFVDIEKFTGRPLPKRNCAHSVWMADCTDSLITHEPSNSELIINAIMYTEVQKHV